MDKYTGMKASSINCENILWGIDKKVLSMPRGSKLTLEFMIRIKYYHILFFLTTINLNSQKIADSLKGFKINDLEYLEMR